MVKEYLTSFKLKLLLTMILGGKAKLQCFQGEDVSESDNCYSEAKSDHPPKKKRHKKQNRDF